MKELKIIYLYFLNSFLQMTQNIPIFSIFFISKLIRYSMFLFFLYFLTNGVANVGGYTQSQMLLFYLIFNFIDSLGQLLYREVYRFRPLVVSGGFDMVLVKPLSPLIRVLVGGPDFIDFGVLLIITGVIVYQLIVLKISLIPMIIALLLILNSMLITTAFHILVLGIGVMTLSVDHLVMIYRDLTALMRIPVDLIVEPMRAILTFVVPLGIMFTFPAKALFGILDWKLVVTSFLIGIVSMWLSLKFWNYSLKHYQSASS